MVTTAAFSAAELTIDVGSGPKSYDRETLLAMPGVRDIAVKNDPAYQKDMTYRAVPVRALFPNFTGTGEQMIEFRALDGFAGPIDANRLLNPDPQASQAFIAIELATQPWPALKPGKPETAGPFYLIWDHPEYSNIATEEWPFQLKSLQVKGTLKSIYPGIIPKDAKYSEGLTIFRQNCFPCHTINLQGSGHVGPDLNHPFSPTEYFHRTFLVKLIRNSQSVRHFPNGKMPAFKPADLSDGDLQKLLNYLEHMAKIRGKT
jgi:mono/diheme cytochrome c family protein